MKFDAIIIGGGPGGAVAGLLLAKAGWSVAVVEKSRFPRQKVCGEFLSATNLDLLRRLGVAGKFSELAGPKVTGVSLFAGETILNSPMPRLESNGETCGRALGRDQLDTILLQHAADVGATIFQPWSAMELVRSESGFVCRIAGRESQLEKELQARVVIAAHGSWENGNLPTQLQKNAAKPGDLFGFKARFCNSQLPGGAMPLLVFPGGYGGMVHTDGGRTSLSCCIRRDRLEKLRKNNSTASAGETVLAHIKNSCRGAREALAEAKLDGAILSVGPIRPGIRRPYRDGIFLTGNAAGEAHPIVAEGISMAMQSAWLLAEMLIARGKKNHSPRELDEVGREYTALWKKNFAPRIRAAACFAHLAMRPATANALLPLLKQFPQILTLGARWSGKANQIIAPSSAMGAARANFCSGGL
jgi:flavin-dependent dehydrogenase